MSTYNIYCDESCHLELDGINVMVLGALSCPKKKAPEIADQLRELKVKHSFSKTYELKWTKVGCEKSAYYKDIIDYFMSNDNLSFRCVVADKTHLRHEDFNQTHDDWYYKMYYLLLRYLVTPSDTYKIYVDIKDTHGGAKCEKLKDILNHSLYKFYDETILGIQQIRSHESELLQVTDFLIGAVTYKNRGLSTSTTKMGICEYLESVSKTALTKVTPLNSSKFNIFIWNQR